MISLRVFEDCLLADFFIVSSDYFWNERNSFFFWFLTVTHLSIDLLFLDHPVIHPYSETVQHAKDCHIRDPKK